MRFIISAGSSISADYLEKALSEISCTSKITVHNMSNKYCNQSQQMSINRLCFNSAIALSSDLEPYALFWELRQIEQKLGRIRSYSNAPRTIDLDVIISFPFSYCAHNFFVPHRELYQRNFFVFCAIEVLHLVGWPVPFLLYQARSKLPAKAWIACKN
ncbi:MAG: 2-amino-4-hydroxy-6-hydroxymethyldihydropteridine diphosphokinase [Myxococcales bacterium]|nr:2-amino-4-hydroxy-6-hydroxymethyldihydropteridine diphosphokinase [Myxococcales bacterium]USN50305.1 MAG: 2-amino-4-hydroxy-6-hydroxymethyldihydropteridine diphosphokinase [Myxococcales bacterium]